MLSLQLLLNAWIEQQQNLGSCLPLLRDASGSMPGQMHPWIHVHVRT